PQVAGADSDNRPSPLMRGDGRVFMCARSVLCLHVMGARHDARAPIISTRRSPLIGRHPRATGAGRRPAPAVNLMIPRVHPLRNKHFANLMDCRVEPGDDGGEASPYAPPIRSALSVFKRFRM